MATRSFGEGGAELGMTRGEMLEHIDSLLHGQQILIEYQTQLIFGWLAVSFFVAHRLSRAQFILACVFFSLFTLNNYVNIADAWSSLDTWVSMAGFIPGNSGVEAEQSAMERLIDVTTGDIAYAMLGLCAYVACIWFAVSCRRNQPNTIGSPL
jgi:hypothetical protein